MLWFEREVVGALTASTDQPLRSSVEAFVDGSVRDLPEHLRLGVAGLSVLLGAYATLLRRSGRLAPGDRESLLHRLDAWERSPVGPVRSWVKLLRSLVVMAENELSAEAVV